MRRLLLLLVVILLAFTCWSVWMTSERTNQKIEADQTGKPAEAQVGGNFVLNDQNGQKVHESDFRGRIMLVFFGFTHCPDICPVTVASLSKTMELLGADANQVVPIFISVDPERDTPQVMKDYLANFDKRLVGLTGSPEQIKQVSESYKVYFAKAPLPAGSDYSVDHSAFIYMMGKDGKFIKVLQNNADAAEISAAVKQALE